MRRNSFSEAAWIDKILRGDIRSASKLLTLIENRDRTALPLLRALYPHTGKARLIGVTGPAGVGKSTLINRLISAFRKKRRTVGVLAVDPTSPLTGGAILGDRIRMSSHFLDRGVFIRSLAARGSWGGISPALFDAIHVLDAMGKEVILIETIGVGQDEVEIARLAETLLLVLSPEIGDEVQTLKAGLLEIGDILVVNKADFKTADRLVRQLHEAAPHRPIIRVAAEKGEGLSELVGQIEKEWANDERRRMRKTEFTGEELRWLLRERLFQKSEDPFEAGEIDEVSTRKRDPYSLVRSFMRRKGLKISS